jgi:UDP-sulfoquinovose synthase
MRCIEIAIEQPAKKGEYRVFNQFTEQFSVLGLAELVQQAAARKGLTVTIENPPNPRVEAESHYYNAKHTKLVELGLQPHLLSDVLLDSVLDAVRDHIGRLRPETILPYVNWRNLRNPLGYHQLKNGQSA